MFSLVLPFHSDYERLLATLPTIENQGIKFGIAEVILAHNGRPLPPEGLRKVQDFCSKKVRYVSTTDKGIGAGYKIGIQAATQPFVVLSASDLPFGFTDVESFMKASPDGKLFESFAIGSKAHPQSKIAGYGWDRKLASRGFHLVRKLILGRETPGDSQGSLILKTELAQGIAPSVRANDYFFSLELITRAQRRGIRVVELPVLLENHEGESSVSITRDGWQMFKRLWSLRKETQ